MERSIFKQVDELFIAYNYKLNKNSNDKVRIFELRYGMYFAVEIIRFDVEYDISKIKNNFSEMGFATEVRNFTTIESLEKYLFEGFFIKTPLGNQLNNRYKQFTQKILSNMPEGSEYKYIDAPYEYIIHNEEGVVLDDIGISSYSNNLISAINHLVTNENGPLLIIIEAAAGYGKTCTAYELLNTFSDVDKKILPFFTELSRNREARIFKHILLNEIDQQFPTGIKQNIVLEQISKGRIPLIIDGFDELISKDLGKGDIESMLTTIIDLLTNQSKIIITSRKTAILSSDDFFTTLSLSNKHFSVARFQIKEPTLENWLSKKKLSVLRQYHFPLMKLSNPVLLSYLRNLSVEAVENDLKNDEVLSLADKYIKFLLEREQQRQNLKLTVDEQLGIFYNLVKLFVEFDITAETKDFIKEIIGDYNNSLILNNLNRYLAEEKPTFDELIDTLSNHVFLDRKNNGDIGFVNDFILGLLIGNSLISNIDEIISHISEEYAYLALEAYKIKCSSSRNEFWQICNDKFNFSDLFFFDLDLFYKCEFHREYKNLFITDYNFENCYFTGEGEFHNCNFFNSKFENCVFDLSKFKMSTFQNCQFYECEISNNKEQINEYDFATYACIGDDFLGVVRAKVLQKIGDETFTTDSIDYCILKGFFQIDGKTTRPQKISFIYEQLNQYSSKEISKSISSLKSKNYIYFQDSEGYISKYGISYFRELKRG